MKSPIAPVPRRANLQPLGCYFQGKDLLGEQYWLFWGICFVGLMIGGVVPIILLGPAYCGIGGCFLARAHRKPVTFNTLFEGFDYFTAGLSAILGLVIVAFVGAIPYVIGLFGGLIMMSTGEPVLAAVGGLALTVAVIYVLVLNAVVSCGMLFACLLVVEYRMEGWPAFQTAMSGILKNVWGVTAASVVGQLLVMLGTMMCIIPGILMLPMLLAGHFICYQKIFGGQHLGQPAKAVPVVQGVYRS